MSYIKHEVQEFQPGERADHLEPGDLILVHGLSRAPRLIQFGQRIRRKGSRRDYAYWNHVAIYVGLQPLRMPSSHLGVPALIEAKGGRGVQLVKLSQYDARHYAVVHFLPESPRDLWPMTIMRENAVEFAKAQIGEGYGYLTILTLALWSIFGGRVTLLMKSSWICSALGAETVRALGEIFSNAITQMPADLAERYGVNAYKS